MATGVVREGESRAVEAFLACVPAGPSALVLEGEPGIGKTTVWLAALDRAREHGFRVLASRASSAESVLAYSSLAALLSDVDDALFEELPPPQRLAVDRVLLRVSAGGPITDQRAVSAAFIFVVQRLATLSPVLLAVDDLQWLDHPSLNTIASAVPRLTGPVGFLATARIDTSGKGFDHELVLRHPGEVKRLRVGPISVGGLHEIITHRLKQSFSRPKMLKIYEASGGNPFYALELARALADEARDTRALLPGTLAGLVRARLGGLREPTRDALLATACLAGCRSSQGVGGRSWSPPAAEVVVGAVGG